MGAVGLPVLSRFPLAPWPNTGVKSSLPRYTGRAVDEPIMSRPAPGGRLRLRSLLPVPRVLPVGLEQPVHDAAEGARAVRFDPEEVASRCVRNSATASSLLRGRRHSQMGFLVAIVLSDS